LPSTGYTHYNIVKKSKEVKTGSNLVETSRKVYDLKRAVLPMMIMMMMMKWEECGRYRWFPNLGVIPTFAWSD
jgi:hypothetical protein